MDFKCGKIKILRDESFSTRVLEYTNSVNSEEMDTFQKKMSSVFLLRGHRCVSIVLGKR